MPENETDAAVKQDYGEDYIAAWLEEIATASEEEKDWRNDAEKATRLYRGSKDSKSPFNIFHANIETICPAIYNSTPAPDVRRRYADRDPLGKIISDLLERSLSYCIDSYDFDDEMQAAVQDMTVTDRGLLRVRYVPYFADDGSVVSEEVPSEYVPWRSFRRGPARLWKDIPWIAFEHFLSREQVERLAGERWDEIKAELPFSYSAAAKEAKDNAALRTPKFGKRAHVWEIWDRDDRKVVFLSPDLPRQPIVVMPDPLDLEQFFPIPRPMMAIASTDSLVPITPLSIYEELLEELNKLTRRINRLIGQLRPRGWYAGLAGDDFKQGVEADDGELIPVTSAEGFAAQAGGLDKLISWFPLDPVVAALKQCVEQREIIKGIIFEVSGMADVMRGQVNPQEKLGQTELKAQWGGLRVQKKKEETGRMVRDLFRLKAEIISNKFSFDTILQMSGIELPSEQDKQQLQEQLEQVAQAAQQQNEPAPEPTPEQKRTIESPSREEVEQLLRHDTRRGWRIDVESDSHIRGDIMRIQQQMSLFIQGTGAFIGAIGPLVQQGAMPGHIAIKIFNAFARHYDLGKSAEDAIEQWGDELEAGGAAGQPEKPDPKRDAAQAQAEAMKEKSALDLQAAQARHEMDMQKMQAEYQMSLQKMQGEAQLGNAKLDMAQQELRMDQNRMAAEVQQKQVEAQLKASMRTPLFSPQV